MIIQKLKQADKNMSFRDSIKKIMPLGLANFARKIIYPEKLNLVERDLKSLFKTHYENIVANDLSPKIDFLNHEFGIYSKYGNDGLLLHIFSKIGVLNHSFVEIGVEDGRECNTANLALNFGWKGLMVDAGGERLKSAENYYRGKKVSFSASFVTAENVNGIIRDNGFSGEIDLLSIDVDGNDYWIWKAIDAVNPRVVVMEYNASFGPEKSMTIKYQPDFSANSAYHGASLSALAKLALNKGYVLVGCESHGIDAFFVRKDLALGKLPQVQPKDVYYPHSVRLQTIGSTEKQFEQIKDKEFEYV